MWLKASEGFSPHNRKRMVKGEQGGLSEAVVKSRPRCKHPEGCGKFAQARGLCVAHGGGTKCKHPSGCDNYAHQYGLCTRHGGRSKCKFLEGCERGALKGGFCSAHGGIKRIKIKIKKPENPPPPPGPDKSAIISAELDGIDWSLDSHQYMPLKKTRRSSARFMKKHATNLYRSLCLQRRQYEETMTVAPDRIGMPPGPQRDEAVKELEMAYAQMEEHLARVATDFSLIRNLEWVLNPAELKKPAVMTLDVSAPGPSWAAEDSILCPFPRIAGAVKQVFLAGYSWPREASANRVGSFQNFPRAAAAAAAAAAAVVVPGEGLHSGSPRAQNNSGNAPIHAEQDDDDDDNDDDDDE